MTDISAHAATLFKTGLQIMEAKNVDYAGGSSDPYSNFRASEILGVPAAHSLMIRCMDKFKRVQTFVATGSLAVKTEPVDDAIADTLNYLVLLAGLTKAFVGYAATRKDLFKLHAALADTVQKSQPVDLPTTYKEAKAEAEVDGIPFLLYQLSAIRRSFSQIAKMATTEEPNQQRAALIIDALTRIVCMHYFVTEQRSAAARLDAVNNLHVTHPEPLVLERGGTENNGDAAPTPPPLPPTL